MRLNWSKLASLDQLFLVFFVYCSRAITFRIYPVSILYKSIAGRYRSVRVADGPITVRCRFIKNASWVFIDNSFDMC